MSDQVVATKLQHEMQAIIQTLESEDVETKAKLAQAEKARREQGDKIVGFGWKVATIIVVLYMLYLMATWVFGVLD